MRHTIMEKAKVNVCVCVCVCCTAVSYSKRKTNRSLKMNRAYKCLHFYQHNQHLLATQFGWSVGLIEKSQQTGIWGLIHAFNEVAIS